MFMSYFLQRCKKSDFSILLNIVGVVRFACVQTFVKHCENKQELL